MVELIDMYGELSDAWKHLLVQYLLHTMISVALDCETALSTKLCAFMLMLSSGSCKTGVCFCRRSPLHHMGKLSPGNIAVDSLVTTAI